jgi:hypothetical protein
MGKAMRLHTNICLNNFQLVVNDTKRKMGFLIRVKDQRLCFLSNLQGYHGCGAGFELTS